MIKFKAIKAAQVLGFALAAVGGLSGAAQAAPDGTLGVAILSAGINSDGTFVRGVGATGSSNLGTGTYEVDFSRNVTACIYQATQGEPGVGGAGGAIAGITQRSGTPNGVFVTMRDAAGTLVNTSFQVLVFCGR